jgi:hypothetical protein
MLGLFGIESVNLLMLVKCLKLISKPFQSIDFKHIFHENNGLTNLFSKESLHF